MFARLPWERLLRMVSHLKPRRFEHGATIVQQGDTPPGLYIIMDGRCTVQREVDVLDHGRQRSRRMHLETLMPRDTYGGDAVLHSVLRSQTSLVAETDVSTLFMPRGDFSPSHFSEDALRMLKVNAKLYRPNDELLMQRHYQEVEWGRAKRHYVKEVLNEARDKRKVKALLSNNPHTMRRTSEQKMF
jgi:CRP-like cAMP-binding protein